jgi:hypothetical protein
MTRALCSRHIHCDSVKRRTLLLSTDYPAWRSLTVSYIEEFAGCLHGDMPVSNYRASTARAPARLVITQYRSQHVATHVATNWLPSLPRSPLSQ